MEYPPNNSAAPLVSLVSVVTSVHMSLEHVSGYTLNFVVYCQWSIRQPCNQLPAGINVDKANRSGSRRPKRAKCGGVRVEYRWKSLRDEFCHTISPLCTWLQRLIFSAARAFPSNFSGLLGLSLIHFARWVTISRDQWPDLGQGKQSLRYDYMLFCSNFNGTWDQYIDAFSDGIPGGLDLFWYTSVKYPHSIPITAFKNYITYNQIDTNYYYNATPGAAQRDVKSALKMLGEIRTLAALHGTSTPESFAAAYRKS